MSDAAVLFVKPKAISAADKKALKGAGIIVVEIADPSDVKFVRAETELPYGDLIMCAVKAINQYDHCKREFGEAVGAALVARHRTPTPDTGSG